ncbi:uncharacterized protein [Paramormyrops kingsleyae]|uniref:uncharacterized protein n=1 Tax=Paramormyrops kingsleyae TaxID=1676925 RepID=UPI003B96B324
MGLSQGTKMRSAHRCSEMTISAMLILVITIVSLSQASSQNQALQSNTEGYQSSITSSSRSSKVSTESPSTDSQSAFTNVIPSTPQKLTHNAAVTGSSSISASQTSGSTISVPSSTNQTVASTSPNSTPTDHGNRPTNASEGFTTINQTSASTSLDSTSAPMNHSSKPTDGNKTFTTTEGPISTTSSSLTTGSSPPCATQSLKSGLTYEEMIITTIISTVLGLIVLTMAAYIISICQQKKHLFIHRPLYNNAEEMGDRFSTPDDTLVISGGLYDEPQTFEYEEFPAQMSRLQLDFFNEDSGQRSNHTDGVKRNRLTAGTNKKGAELGISKRFPGARDRAGKGAVRQSEKRPQISAVPGRSHHRLRSPVRSS